MVDGFKMFLSGQDTFNSFDVDGASFKSHASNPGLHYFEVETNIVKKLENDPKVRCKTYSKSESYEMVRKAQSRMLLKLFSWYLKG